jgi:[ribosomal protein S18]-alanine N-acetyltransferase
VSGPLQIRRAVAGDLERVLRVDVRAFRRHWPADDFAAELVNPLASIWLAEDADGPVGYAHVRVVTDEGELLNLAVLPARRRSGAGRALLARAEAEALLSGAARMFLEVRQDNVPAVSLYLRAGWEQVGIRKRYYSEDGADAIVLSKVLGAGGLDAAGDDA